jgi:predicted Zn finger-like uncharacterized protein
MIVTCPNCTTSLQLDKAQVSARPFNVRCPKCQQIINAQPPSASQQRDAFAAVGGLPASNRSPHDSSAAPVQKEGAADVSPPSAGAPAAEGEVLRLLASLLRGGGVEGPGPKGALRRHSVWEGRRALVCSGSAYGEQVMTSLGGDGYQVFAAANTEQAVERLREGGVDVLALDPEFDAARQGAACVAGEVASLRMPERRRLVFVLLSDKVRTGDAHAAFLAGANLVVNLSEAAELPRALEKNIHDLNDLYRDFNKALGLAAL